MVAPREFVIEAKKLAENPPNNYFILYWYKMKMLRSMLRIT